MGYLYIECIILSISFAANIIVWTMAYSLSLAPLPYGHGSRLASVVELPRKGDFTQPIPQHWVNIWRARSHSFSNLATWRNTASVIEFQTHRSFVFGIEASNNLFETIGMPALAHAFRTHSTRPILLTGPESKRLFPEGHAFGHSVVLGGRIYRVAGILPNDFLLPGETSRMAYVIPMPRAAVGTDLFVNVIGMLRNGISYNIAASEIARLRTISGGGIQAKRRRFRVIPLRDALYGKYSGTLDALIAASIVILLLSWISVVGLEIGRIWQRRHEFFIRAIVGATPKWLFLAAGIEGICMSIIGAVLGIAIGAWFAGILRVLGLGAGLTHGHWLERACITSILAMISTLVIGIIPSMLTGIRLSHQYIHGSLQLGNSIRHWRVLVAIQIVFATVACAAMLLLVVSTTRLLAVRPGFSARGALIVAIDQPLAKTHDLSWRILRHIRTLPGVQSAALLDSVPLQGVVETGPVSTSRNTMYINVAFASMSPGALNGLGVRLMAGRDFDAWDKIARLHVAIINDVLAKALFGSVSQALGRWISTPAGQVKVVGIAEGFHQYGIRTPVTPELFRPMTQSIAPYFFIVLHSPLKNVITLAPEVRKAIMKTAPGDVITQLYSLRKALHDESHTQRGQTNVFIALAALAILLAVAGAYGVGSAAAIAFRRPTAIRKALGASWGNIVWTSFKPGLIISVLGGCVGVLGGMLFDRYLESLLFQVSAGNMVMLIIAAGMAAGAAAAAFFIPALCAWRIDAAQILRDQ